MKTKFTILLMAMLCLCSIDSQAVYRVLSITPAGATCAGNIQLEVSGSTGPYTITWTGPNGFQAPNPSAGITAISSLCGGNYTAEVTNSYGCTKILGPIQILQSIDPDNGGPTKGDVLNACGLSLSADDVLTTGGGLGGGFTFGEGMTTSENGTIILNYNRDKEELKDLGSISLTVDPSVCATSSKTRTGTLSTSKDCQITYHWSNGANTPTISNLMPGTYCVEVYLQKNRTGSPSLIDVKCFTIGAEQRCPLARTNKGTGKTMPVSNTDQIKLQAYPNPFQEQLLLQITSSQSQDALIKLQDITGRTILQQSFQLTKGNTDYTIPNTQHLANGIYTLIVEIDGIEQQMMKVLKSK